jgi:hypothetical protein
MESRRHSCVINFYVLWGAAGEQLESNWKDNKKLTRFISYWQCKPKAIASNHSSANRTEMGGGVGFIDVIRSGHQLPLLSLVQIHDPFTEVQLSVAVAWAISNIARK